VTPGIKRLAKLFSCVHRLSFGNRHLRRSLMSRPRNVQSSRFTGSIDSLIYQIAKANMPAPLMM